MLTEIAMDSFALVERYNALFVFISVFITT